MLAFGIILTIIGLLIIIGFIMSLAKCKTKAEATVSQIIETKNVLRGSTIKSYSPVFSYKADDKDYFFKSEKSSLNPQKYEVGQKVTVYIDKKHPETARFGVNIGIFLSGLVLTFVGVVFIVLYFY